MILGLSMAVGLLAAGLLFWWLSVRFQSRPLEPVTQWPAAPARADFADELAAIGVDEDPQPAPNYRSGEYPLVILAEPVEHTPRHAADERVLSDARPWLAPALHNERAPIFHESGSYPVLDLDLSATNSWNRAALQELLNMDTEGAA